MKKTFRRGTLIVGTALLFAGPGCGASPEAGEACTENGTTACDPNNTQLVCQDAEWQSQHYDCGCFESPTIYKDGCPVPGFVGIAEAGRTRSQGRRIRGQYRHGRTGVPT